MPVYKTVSQPCAAPSGLPGSDTTLTGQTMIRPTTLTIWALPALLLTMLGLLAACGSPSPSPTPTPTPAPTVDPRALADTPAVELAPDVQAMIDAMDTLESYRTRTVYEFGEQPVTGTLTTGVVDILVEYTETPIRAQRVVMTDTTTAEDGDARTSQTVRIGDTTWYDMGDGNWIESTEEANSPFPSAGLIFDAPDLLVSTTQARRLGTQTINGIDSDHYSFVQEQLPAFAAGDMDSASGEFWVARHGGYLTRYTLQAIGEDIELNDGLRGRGTMALTYDLLDIGQPITIVAPQVADATPLGFDPGTFPLPAGAHAVLRSRDFVSYVSAQPLAEVVRFFQERLPALGWSSPDDAGYTSPELVNLVFQKDNYQIFITITLDTETGQTQILVSSEQTP